MNCFLVKKKVDINRFYSTYKWFSHTKKSLSHNPNINRVSDQKKEKRKKECIFGGVVANLILGWKVWSVKTELVSVIY